MGTMRTKRNLLDAYEEKERKDTPIKPVFKCIPKNFRERKSRMHGVLNEVYL
jgi:hypothetical protein